jgi:hypothetical protein
MSPASFLDRRLRADCDEKTGSQKVHDFQMRVKQVPLKCKARSFS